jgi:hypothetical protein
MHCWWENWMEVSQITKKVLSYNPAIPLLGIWPKEMKSVCQRYLHAHVYCSSLHNSQDMKLT